MGRGRRLADYKPPHYTVRDVRLVFALEEAETVVEATLVMCATADQASPPPLVLDGRKDVRLLSVSVEGRALAEGQYKRSASALTLPPASLPAAASQAEATFELTTRVAISPSANTSLQGLFMTGGMFCTDLEAEGFRAITFYLDRPDVLASYTTRIEADRERYPVLLSNGELEESGELAGGRHFAVWRDPFPKPCYLFALVAGKLGCVQAKHTTRSGRAIQLRVWAAPEEIEARRADFALATLQRAMRWEEWEWGLECDLGLFQVVAVPQLNGGAMENTSLNVFDAALVLACPATATDDDYQAVECTVAHEFFHHQTGNRTTVRDWFQLTLKEGLTVFREQEFGAARQYPRGCARVQAGAELRWGLLDEDSGKLAHAPRPASVGTVENIYTDTIYSKGAEIVRMLQTCMGRPAFAAGLRGFLAVRRGQAATCEQLLESMAAVAGEGGGGEAGGAGWSPRDMLRWYDQAGTPEVEAAGEWNPNARTFTLRLSQQTDPTPGQRRKAPLPIPVAAGLLGRKSGQQLPLRLLSGAVAPSSAAAVAAAAAGHGVPPLTAVLLLTGAKQTWVFGGVDEEPVVSLLRGCSAPVALTVRGRRDAELALLAAADPDPYARWDASQELGLRALLKTYRAVTVAAAKAAKPSWFGGKGRKAKGGSSGGGGGGAPSDGAVPPAVLAAAATAAAKAAPTLAATLRPLLGSAVEEAEFGSWALTLPSDIGVYEREDEEVDPGLLQVARDALEAALAAALRPDLAAALAALDAALRRGGGGGGGDAAAQQAAPGDGQQQPQQQKQQGGNGGTRASTYAYDPVGAARRSMRAACLCLLGALRPAPPAVVADLSARLAEADNLTDAVAAVEALDRVGGAPRAAALAAFHDTWAGTDAGLHTWMALVAGGEEPGNLAAVAPLASHPRFQLNSPACCEAVYQTFAETNANFHAPDGSGYAFVADAVLAVDAVNPQQAATLASMMADWEAVEPRRSALMQAQLQRLAGAVALSAQTREVVEAALEEDSDDSDDSSSSSEEGSSDSD